MNMLSRVLIAACSFAWPLFAETEPPAPTKTDELVEAAVAAASLLKGSPYFSPEVDVKLKDLPSNQPIPFNITASHTEVLQETSAQLAQRLGTTEDVLNSAFAKLQPIAADLRAFRMEYSNHNVALVLFVGQSEDSLVGFYAIEPEFNFQQFNYPHEPTEEISRVPDSLKKQFYNRAMEHMAKKSGSSNAGWNSLLRLGFKMDWNEGKEDKNLSWEAHVVNSRNATLSNLTTYWGVIEPDIYSLLRHMRKKTEPVQVSIFMGHDYEPVHDNWAVAQNKHTINFAASIFNPNMDSYRDTPYPMKRIFSLSAAMEEAKVVRAISFYGSGAELFSVDERNYRLFVKALPSIRKFVEETLVHPSEFKSQYSGLKIAPNSATAVNLRSPRLAQVLDAISKQDVEAFARALKEQDLEYKASLLAAKKQKEEIELKKAEFRKTLTPWPGYTTLYSRQGETGIFATTYEDTIDKVTFTNIDGFGPAKGGAFTPDSARELVRVYEKWLSSAKNPPDVHTAAKIRNAVTIAKRSYSIIDDVPQAPRAEFTPSPRRSTVPYLRDVRGNRVPIADDPTGPYRGN